MKRYAYHDEPLGFEEAAQQRSTELEGLMSRIAALKAEADELGHEFWRLKGSPLPTLRRVQTVLHPGDPGYDEAPPNFDPSEYQGDVEWSNTSHQTI